MLRRNGPLPVQLCYKNLCSARRTAFLSTLLSRTNATGKILIRADVVTAWVNRRAYQLEDDIAPTLPTSREDLMLPQEYLMWWTVAEVQCLIYPGDANVFAGYAKHRNLRDDFCRAREITKCSSMPPVNAIRDDHYCALPLSSWQPFIATTTVAYRVEL
jgi:hypothetical protein